MKKYLFLLISIAVSLSFLSCQKKSAQKNTQIEETQSSEITNQENADEEIAAEAESEEKPLLAGFDPSSVSSDYRTQAHKEYLDAPMNFKKFENMSEQSGWLLVASNKAEFYSPDNFTMVDSELRSEDGNFKSAILKNPHMKGTPVPIGTYFKKGEVLQSGGENWYENCYGYFYFQDNYNFFYKVNWNGQDGYIFGADLYSNYLWSADEATVAMSSVLYENQGKLDEFYNFAGLTKLSDQVTQSLENNKLAIQKTNQNSIWLNTDDLIDFYQTIPPTSPVFITTDLFSHSQHLIFDKILQEAEEDYFAPRLLTVCQNFIKALSEREDIPEEIKEKAIAYFQVPELILRSAPKKVKDENSWQNEYIYEETDNSTFINEYSEKVLEDYNQIINASGAITALFNTKEDFSQYKPRGHYTKNKILTAYFQAQMWCGRIHFTIAKSTNPNAERESLIMEPIALSILDTVKLNPQLYDEWKALFDPITVLIGMSDDLGFSDLLPLWKEKNIENFAEWVSNSDNIYAIMNEFNKTLRPPLISGNSGVSDKAGNPPMGWRFLGQRFTYDSFVHQQVCAPRLYTRDFVSGLDIIKALGSNAAESYLQTRDYLEAVESAGGYRGGAKLKEILDYNQKMFDEKDEDFWTQTYYNNVLAQIRSQGKFEAGSGFYFTESPMWNIKALNSAHSTWAELRHDTILYVKQVYAERAGGDDLETTFRTLPLPVPYNYLEPNTPFYNYSLKSVQKLYECFDTYGLLSDNAKSKLDSLIDLYTKALEISSLEFMDQEVSEEDNKWIRSIPNKMETIIMAGYDSYADDPEQLKMACIADVFTNADYGVCLETGVGRPYKIYVPLNDGQGKKRIAVGYVPSYYEFYGPQENRMSDEEWKAIVYAQPEKDMKDYLPFWMNGCVLPLDSDQ